MNRQITRLWLRAPSCPRRIQPILRNAPALIQNIQPVRHKSDTPSARQLAVRDSTEEHGDYWIKKIDGFSDEEKKAYRHAKMELSWLPDRAALARRIEKGLKDGKYDLCLAMTRLASKEKNEAVAAWNLLIKDRMNQKGLPHHKRALDLFNEMKKRGQTPDAYTYGTLLSGFNKHPRPAAIIKPAYELYQSMQRPASPVKPNVQHMNMMIRIAGAAGKMDLFWEVLQDIPETGKNAASCETYSAMFDSIRTTLKTDILHSEPKKRTEYLAKQLKAARSIWSAAVVAWSHGDIEMDSHMICSMGHLLLDAPHASDWDQVFSVIEQVTGVGRPRPPLATLPGHQARLKEQREGNPESTQEKPENPYEVYTPVVNKPHAVFARPTNQILTIALRAAQQLRFKKAADYYWDILTGESGYKLTPDVVSLKAYLSVLRISRASREAVKAVKMFPKQSNLGFGVYRIAFAACERNAWRPNTLFEATELYQLRSRQLQVPDAKVIEQFAKIIEVCDNNQAKVEALEQLGSDPVIAFNSPNMGWIHGELTDDEHGSLLERTISLAKRLIGLYDSLSSRGLARGTKPQDTKSALAEFVRKAHHEGPAMVKDDNAKPQMLRRKRHNQMMLQHTNIPPPGARHPYGAELLPHL